MLRRTSREHQTGRLTARDLRALSPLNLSLRLLCRNIDLRYLRAYTSSEQEARTAVEHYSVEPSWFLFVRPLKLTSWWGDWAAHYRHADRQY